MSRGKWLKKGDAPSGAQPGTTVLSPPDRENTKDRLRELEAAKKITDPREVGPVGHYTPAGSVNMAELDGEINKVRGILEKDEAGQARGLERERLVKREQELRDILLKKMQPRTRNNTSSRNQWEFAQAVKEAKEWDDATKKVQAEWSQVRRRLHPRDEGMASIESIRPES